MTEHDIARLLPADRFGNVLSTKSFPHGLSGAAVYDVSTDAGDFVVRILVDASLEEWQRRISLLRVVADAALAPKLVWVDEGARAIVSPKIAAHLSRRSPTPQSVRTRSRVSSTCSPVCIASPPPPFLPSIRSPRRGRSGSSRARSPRFPAWSSPAVALIDRAAALLDADPRRVPSHNDMNPTNVLWDDTRAWLVDWDVSGLTHPYYDLAVLAMFLRLDDAVALDLLARQEESTITPEQAETFRALRQLGAILCGTMFFRLAGELASVVPQHLDETPTLLQFYARLRTGELALRTSRGQAMFGAAMLKEAITGSERRRCAPDLGVRERTLPRRDGWIASPCTVPSISRVASVRESPTMTIVLTPPPEPAEVDLAETYDAIVVGSGAAGGMAAHVLTQHGLKVLLLEAGKKINIEAELRSMQWPYDHPRRGDAAARVHALSLNEYNIRKPPYAAKNSAYKHVYSYVGGWGGSDYVKNILVDEKQTPVHRHQLRLGARARARRQDEHLGPPRAAPLRLRLQGEDARRLRRGLADLLRRHRAVLRQGRHATSASPGTRKDCRICPTASSSARTS